MKGHWDMGRDECYYNSHSTRKKRLTCHSQNCTTRYQIQAIPTYTPCWKYIVNYYRDLFHKLQSLTQRLKTIEDCHKVMETAIIRANVVEDREATLAQFIVGLNRDITNVLELQNYFKLDDMVHMAIDERFHSNWVDQINVL